MNLSDFDEAQSQEMGVLFQRADDARLYQQAQEEARRIIRHSEAGVPERAAPPFPWRQSPAFRENLTAA
ncbi:MAG: hypothetical protein ABIR71_00505 [Chthoniobacterales bacterium]